MLQRFGLSGPFKGGALDLLDKLVDSFKDLLVGSLPMEIVIPSMF
jgi:hypothetical protein